MVYLDTRRTVGTGQPEEDTLKHYKKRAARAGCQVMIGATERSAEKT
jgi:hypothetical protein